jgi:hypothetical protein
VGEPGAFERGVTAGEVAARLRGHDEHLARINGSVDRMADEQAGTNTRLDGMLMALQRLGDAAQSDRATVVTTASALEKAEQARRDKSETRWSPLARVLAVVVAVAAVAAAWIAWAAFHAGR